MTLAEAQRVEKLAGQLVRTIRRHERVVSMPVPGGRFVAAVESARDCDELEAELRDFIASTRTEDLDGQERDW